MLRTGRYLIPMAVFAMIIVAVFASFGPTYGDVCHKDEYTGHKECIQYYIAFVILWYIGEAINPTAKPPATPGRLKAVERFQE